MRAFRRYMRPLKAPCPANILPEGTLLVQPTGLTRLPNATYFALELCAARLRQRRVERSGSSSVAGW